MRNAISRRAIKWLFPCALASAWAAQAQQFDAGQMEQIQAMAQEMHACLEKVDSDKMATLKAHGDATAAEIGRLCQAGQRDAAQSRALDYGKSLAASPEANELRACSQAFAAVLPAFTALSTSPAGVHVCDMQ